MSLQSFTDAYIECALWSSTAYGAPEEQAAGDHWDTSFQGYGCVKSDLAPETLATFEADCAEFYNAHHTLFENDEQAGHDFWLTRNGHGAGFWDGDYPDDIGKTLTDASNPYGDVNLYLGDDGLIYA
jgi:hypothetical protein